MNSARRNFLRFALTIPAAVVLGGFAVTRVLSSSPLAQAPSQFPRVKVVNVSSLNGLLNFNYPLDNEPNVMVKLGQKATGGVGPDGDIVAFSLECTHAGCPYNVNGPIGECPCHGSRFDLANGGKVLTGPASAPEPQVVLEYDSMTGDIYATGMTPPAIYGHTGSDYVSADLQGGTPVPEFQNSTFLLVAAIVAAFGAFLTAATNRFSNRNRKT